MNVDHIRARVQEEAFRPFAIVTSSGHKYPVPHEDFIFLTSRTVIIANEQGYTTGLDPLHITALEDVPRQKDGKRVRRKRA